MATKPPREGQSHHNHHNNSSIELDVVPLEIEEGRTPQLDRNALLSLAAQHLSSSWVARCFEFALFLFLIRLFPDSLLFPSIYGFVTTIAAILFSGNVGTLVGSTKRLKFVKATIVVQKISSSIAYALLLVLFLAPGDAASTEGRKTALFVLITIAGSILKLATVGISVAIERDWVTVMANGDSATLTKLNAWMRRIDLVTALVGPLFVSLIALAASYQFAAAFLLGFSLLSMAFEFFWTGIVFRRCPMLALEEEDRLVALAKTKLEMDALDKTLSRSTRAANAIRRIGPAIRQERLDWIEFVNHPIFPSSLSISLLYLTVLSFDGTLLAYLISHDWSEALLAGLRGLQVIMGLLGTVVMPIMEKRIGLAQTGTRSVVSLAVFLLPVLLSFFIDAPPLGQRGAVWNAVMLFGGMSLSRLSLWSFDLVQTAQLQTSLASHPRRNTLTALQFSLQNFLDLFRYVLTIVLSDPALFKWAALVSWISVASGVVSYLYYVRQEKGHILHLEKWPNLLKKKS